MTYSDFYTILPLITLISWASVLLIMDLFTPNRLKWLTPVLAVGGLAVTLGFSATQSGQALLAFNGMIALDGYAVFLHILFLGSGIIGIALAYDYLKRMGMNRGEYYPLLMYSISGMMLMAMAVDLIVIFLALELLSIPLYVMAGFASPQSQSEEAALKYFLLGAFAGSFMVFGVALVFGAVGSTSLVTVLEAVQTGSANLVLLLVGAGLILIGLGFKVAVVPFHMWTPDVYHGAPSPAVSFMAIGAKAGGFAALLRIFLVGFPTLGEDLTPILWALAALTMILGNLVAIAQKNIKRMLAYSSIAHAGYIIMALVPMGNTLLTGDITSSVLIYLLGYGLTNFTAWAVVIALEKGEGKGLMLDDYAGLGRKYPLLSALMVVAMLSFTGIPPTLGFVGKFYIFRTVLDGGFVGLAVIGVLTSLVSAFFYLRVIVKMYMQEGDPEAVRDHWLMITASVTALAVVILSIFAEPLLRWVQSSILMGL